MILISQKEYSLSELFSTEKRKIIIPDFQRDYCWGDKTHGEKNNSDIVNGFLETIFEEFKNNRNAAVLLGKIDVYEHPKNHIYLTDGQQRLTSLYLLIGMLFRKNEKEESKKRLKRCLISNFEEEDDDKEPYLQYAIRESTIFFLRDLVNEFFIRKNELTASQICNQPWYFRDYDLDPSITSMISAMTIIESKLMTEKDMDVNAFSKFIIDRVKIQYYKVPDKSHGEERFVIINTTGKSLSATENVKPILLGNICNAKHAKAWENRETFFWKNRNTDKESIADDGVNDFLTWCFKIENKMEDVDIIKNSKKLLKDGKNEGFLKAIDNRFKSLKRLLNNLKSENFQKQFKFINDGKDVYTLVDLRQLSKEKVTNVLIPLLSFMTQHNEDSEQEYLFLRRLRKNYFDRKWKDRNDNYVDWRYILQIIETSNSQMDCLHHDENFEKIGNLELPNSTWFNDEEKIKEQLKEYYKLEIELWEDHSHFMGDLKALMNMVDNKADFKALKTCYDTYNNIQLDDFRFSENIQLKNLYRLTSYLNNGHFEHRVVSGRGYCMLNKSEEQRQFLHYNFASIWSKFKNYEEDEVIHFLYDQLRKFINERILKGTDINSVCRDTRKLEHYERVQIWAVLEFLNAERELNFNESICQFWEYPNLKIIIENFNSEKNNYEMGNLLLGTSYYNNKTGGFIYNHYPLMEFIKNSLENSDIASQTSKYQDQLEKILHDS